MTNHKCHSLIIGGTGQFGITLKNQLNKKNKRVIITSRFNKSKIKKKLFEIIVLDIYDKKLKKLQNYTFLEIKPDVLGILKHKKTGEIKS